MPDRMFHKLVLHNLGLIYKQQVPLEKAYSLNPLRIKYCISTFFASFYLEMLCETHNVLSYTYEFCLV